MNPINVLSLFDGMSCGQLALQRAGVSVGKYYASEIDKHAISVTMDNFPDTIQLGDVTDIEMSTVNPIDLLIGGSPCFVAGTKVITDTEYKNIEDITVGDYVLTHTGKYQKVISTGNEYKETVILNCTGIKKTETTNNHPYYIREMHRVWDNPNRTNKRQFNAPIWKAVDELVKDDFIGMPILQTSSNVFNLTEDECYIIGRYIADGHTRKDFRVSDGRPNDRHWQLILSVGSHKISQFDHILQHYSSHQHAQNMHRVIFCSKRLVGIVESECGCGAKNKKISMNLLNLPKKLLKILLQGYFDGDGYLNKKNVMQCSSISDELIQTLNLAVAKVYGVNSSFHAGKFKPTTVIEGRTVNQSQPYTVAFRFESKEQTHAHIEDNIIWTRFKSSHVTGEIKKVYNLEVEYDNSYTANNAIVHNCTNFSVAGKQDGMSTDEKIQIETLDHYIELKDKGTKFIGQSYLFWEYIRLLREIKPRYFLLENVKMQKKYKDAITKELGVEAIEVNSNCLSAQHRRRLYWTNIPIDDILCKNLHLSDIVERNVGGIPVIYDSTGTCHMTAKNKKGIRLTDDIPVPHTVYEARTEEGKKARRELRKKLGRDTTPRGPKYKEYLSLKTLQSNCLVATPSELDCIVDFDYNYRMLTITECEKLQTLPINYTGIATESQRRKMIGNGWTVDVVAHIFNNLKSKRCFR